MYDTRQRQPQTTQAAGMNLHNLNGTDFARSVVLAPQISMFVPLDFAKWTLPALLKCHCVAWTFAPLLVDLPDFAVCERV